MPALIINLVVGVVMIFIWVAILFKIKDISFDSLTPQAILNRVKELLGMSDKNG